MSEPILINSFATLHVLPAFDFPHELLNRRDLSDPQLAPYLESLAGYVLTSGDGKMTATRYHLLRHIERVKHQVAMDVAEEDLPAFADWAMRANAVQFIPDGSICDPALLVLIDGAGQSDPQARLPYPPDARERKQRTLDRLAAASIRTAASMPPVLGEGEVTLRSASDVAGRALALILVAVQAEAWNYYNNNAITQIRQRFPRGFAFLSPAEKAFLGTNAPAPQTVIDMGWRYEALNLLLWALGIENDLADAQTHANAGELAATMVGLNTVQDFVGTARLRPTPEILDALDLTYRQHWAVRQAHLDGSAVSGVYGSVVSERHKALNWLTGFHNPAGTPWDEIEAPT